MCCSRKELAAATFPMAARSSWWNRSKPNRSPRPTIQSGCRVTGRRQRSDMSGSSIRLWGGGFEDDQSDFDLQSRRPVAKLKRQEDSAMSTMLRIGPHDHGREMTYEEFLAGDYEEGYKYELIRGELYVSPQPNP